MKISQQIPYLCPKCKIGECKIDSTQDNLKCSNCGMTYLVIDKIPRCNRLTPNRGMGVYYGMIGTNEGGQMNELIDQLGRLKI